MTTQGTLGERVSRLEGSYEHLATKADIAELKSDIARVEAKISGVEGKISGLEAKISGLEFKIDTLESRLLIRLGGLYLVASGLVVAILRLWP